MTVAGGSAPVDSVFGRTGVVVAETGDYSADQITETASAKFMTAAERAQLATYPATAGALAGKDIIGTNDIDDLAVTNLKIAPQAVTASKIGPGAVTPSKIAALAVSSDKIALDAVGPDQLEDTDIIPGSYTHASITVDQQGRITAASSGTPGEANTASNVGAAGVGVFDAKVGIDLRFRSVAPGSDKISVSLNGQDIELDVVEANLEVPASSVSGLAQVATAGTWASGAAFADQLNLPAISIETNGLGKFLPALLRREIHARRLGCPVVERVSSTSKSQRILDAFDPLLAAASLRAHASIWTTPFIEEMREWRPGRSCRDDGLDAVSGCLLAEPVRLRRVAPGDRRSWRPGQGSHVASSDFTP